MTSLAKHVICAISGGVDSAVSAYLLKKDGYRVTGCFMRNWNDLDEDFSTCKSDIDEKDAQNICHKLEIPFISVDFSKNYWNQIFSKILDDYENGLTPNSDILCNKYGKFPMLFQYCNEHFKEFNFIATGHYSQLLFDSKIEKNRLLKSVDELKDQSFFLGQIDPNLLDRVLFPIGHLHKAQVRQLATDIGLETINRKKSSKGICFIGKRKFSDFISDYLEKKKGLVIDLETNEKLGEHDGIYNFTVGQRIPIINPNKAFYVAQKEKKKNIIYAVNGTDHPALYHNQFIIDTPHWISENKETNLSKSEYILDHTYDFKFQHAHYQSPIVSLKKTYSDTKTRYLVQTKSHFRGITPGQYAVFYNKNECIGSGRINQTCESLYEQNFKGFIVNSDRKFNKKNFI